MTFNYLDSAAGLIGRVPEGKTGDVEVQHFDVSEKDAAWGNFMAAKNGSRDAFVKPGRYVKLLVGGKLMMSNTQMEARTNSGIVHRANGDILIGGLGLGMIIHMLADRDRSERQPWQAKPVRSITVVEKSPHVIKLIRPSLPKDVPFKIRLRCASIFEWEPPKGAKYQTMYWDIWPDSCVDQIAEMSQLNRRFARNFDRNAAGCFRSAWRMDELLYERRKERPYD